MPGHRYEQFCPVARAAEIVGERWTLLVIRELFCGPQRFTDLRRRLPGLSSSVLAERLARLEEKGLVSRREAAPPAPAVLYALTGLGAALGPVLVELARFGARLLEPMRPGDHFEPDWIVLGLSAFARRQASPRRCLALHIPTGSGELRVELVGGSRGTRVRAGDPAAGRAPDATLRADAATVLALALGRLAPETARAQGRVEVTGDAAALRDLPRLFDVDLPSARPHEPG